MIGLTTRTKTKAPTTPQRVEDHPDLMAEVTKLAEVQGLHAAVVTEVERVMHGLSKLGKDGRQVDRLTAAAEALLAGEDVAAGREADALRAELGNLQARRVVLDRAAQLQRARVDDLRSRLARELFEDGGRDQFKASARELAEAGAAFGRVVERFLAAQAAAEQAGYRWQTLADVPAARVLRFRLTEPGAATEATLHPSHLGTAGELVRWAVEVAALDHAEAARLLGRPLVGGRAA